MSDKLVYRAPPPPPQEETIRRVYVLPARLVKRIHEYGFAHGHQSEVSAVRALIEAGLRHAALHPTQQPPHAGAGQ